MVMSFVVISLKNFCFNLRCEVFNGLLLFPNADNKYKWPPPVAGKLFN